MPRRVRLVKTLSGTRAQPVVFSPHCWQGCLGQVWPLHEHQGTFHGLCVAIHTHLSHAFVAVAVACQMRTGHSTENATGSALLAPEGLLVRAWKRSTAEGRWAHPQPAG